MGYPKPLPHKFWYCQHRYKGGRLTKIKIQLPSPFTTFSCFSCKNARLSVCLYYVFLCTVLLLLCTILYYTLLILQAKSLLRASFASGAPPFHFSWTCCWASYLAVWEALESLPTLRLITANNLVAGVFIIACIGYPGLWGHHIKRIY